MLATTFSSFQASGNEFEALSLSNKVEASSKPAPYCSKRQGWSHNVMLGGSNKSEYIHTLSRSERVSQFKYHNFGHSHTLQGKGNEGSHMMCQSESLKKPSSSYLRGNIHTTHREVVDVGISEMSSSDDGNCHMEAAFPSQWTSQSMTRESLSGDCTYDDDDYADMEISDESEVQTDSVKKNPVDSPHNGDYEPVQFGCQMQNAVSGLSEDST